MENLWLPTNIKQIGNIDDNIRVYIEDSVYSYLMRLSESKEQECIAALIGRCMIIDGKTVLFINGAVQGLYSEMEKGILKFSRLSMDHIEEERDKYFKGLEIVGWLLSQPNYGNFLSTGYINYHKQNFTKPYQVLFVTDPVEKIHTFFNWNQSRTEVIESEGFFIYYDRNNDMRAYADANKIVKYENVEEIQLKLLEKDVEFEEDEDFFTEYDFIDEEDLYEEVLAESKSMKKAKLTENETKRVIQTINKLSNEKTPQRAKEKHKTKILSPQAQQQKMLNMLVTVSSILFFVSISLGASIIKSDNKIAELEQEIILVTSAYEQISNDFLGEATPVFNSSTVSNVSENIASANTPQVSINDILDGEQSSEVEVQQTDFTTTQIVTNTTEIPESYKIDVGDTLTSISTRFYGTKDKTTDIMKLNGIEDPNKIYYGMVIKLP